jgi:hypothetical protein
VSEVIACVIAYQEEGMLPGCLQSIQGKVDRVVVVDGAYRLFPHDVPWSTDATLEIAWCYGAEWIPCPTGDDGEPRPWETQMEKRSAYLVGEEGDWYFYIDADERLVGELPELENRRHYAFKARTRDGRLTWAWRLFQHRGRMRYEGAHNALWSGDELITMSGAVRVPVERAYLMHLAHLRCKQRLAEKRAWLPERIERERAYRSAHGI